jgi:NAD(P)-dependent dehydrogenase (short-subunit alcohol dehydrogenase family)
VTARLAGKVAIVKGGCRGLGRDYARFFSRDGAHVVIADVADTSEALKEASAEGTRCIGVVTDVTSKESVDAMARATVEEFGRIDILVNNAGLWRNLGGSLLECDADRWSACWHVNVDGTLNCYQAVAPIMIGQGEGRIINISSMAARSGGNVYGLTKNCVEQMTRGMALETGSHGVTVNCIAPGISAFEKATGSIANADQIVAGNAIPRLGTSHDLYEAIVFLCGADASWITGQTLRVDGGAGI